MKLVLFQSSDREEPTPGLLTERGVVGLAGTVERSHTPQLTIQGLIDGFGQLRPELERLAVEGTALPLASVRLRAPLPRSACWPRSCWSAGWAIYGPAEPRSASRRLS